MVSLCYLLICTILCTSYRATLCYGTDKYLENTKEFSLTPHNFGNVADFSVKSASDIITNRIGTRTKRSVHSKQQTSHLKISSRELMYKIFSPNYKWENLKDLQFDNSNGSLCQDDLEIRSNYKVVLPALGSLTLINFTNCEILFDKILSCLEMSNVLTLKVNGKIDDDFIQQFQEYLRVHKRSLNEISVSGLLTTRYNIFEIQQNNTLQNVTSIFMRPRLEDGNVFARNIINPRFCTIFPNLVKLGIKQTAIDLDQLLRLQGCTKLKYLKAIIKIKFSEQDRLFGLEWKLLFPSLENIAIKSLFDKCPHPNTFDPLINKLSGFRRYILCSNCNLAVYRNIKCTQGSMGIY